MLTTSRPLLNLLCFTADAYITNGCWGIETRVCHGRRHYGGSGDGGAGDGGDSGACDDDVVFAILRNSWSFSCALYNATRDTHAEGTAL